MIITRHLYTQHERRSVDSAELSKTTILYLPNDMSHSPRRAAVIPSDILISCVSI